MLTKIIAIVSGAFAGYSSSWPKLPAENFGDSFFTPAKPNGTTVLSAK